jgi:murein DD-endopeptidase MepM/ murein hydrolase activator NlpD
MTSNTVSPSQPQHLTRRQLVNAERHSPTQRRTRYRPSVSADHHIERRPAVAARAARRQPIRGGIAVLAAALLIGTYALPAYGSQPLEPGAVESATTQFGGAELQSLQVADEASVSDGSNRDGYQVTKVLPPGFRPYARTANTFVNDLNSSIQWPFLLGVPISSWFGYRVPPCATCSSDHKGLDMNPGAGTPIQVIADGVVSEAGSGGGEYGVYAIVDHVVDGQRISSVYAHMEYGTLTVGVGDKVEVGQIVGQVGSTGQSTGPHLHFEIRENGTPVDPYAWLKAKVGQ